ncbi:MAG: hypothetical protein ACLPXT_00855 [Terracidiphilus sp.]
MRGFKILFSSAALLAGLALVPAVRAQIAIEIGEPPVCQWGYYEAPPYGCAPEGFYGQAYFYHGVFLGVGPWAGWGYAHGWGGHRFHDDGRGHYRGRAGYEAEHGHYYHGYDDRHGGPHGEEHGGPHHDAPHHDAPHHDAPHHDAPHHDAPHHDAPHGNEHPR